MPLYLTNVCLLLSYMYEYSLVNLLIEEIKIKKKKISILYARYIVRPVKRDWAVLSLDTPMDISISKSVRQGVFIHL